mgnify:CR=1 FL=1
MIVVIIVAVAAWLFSGSKNEEQIDFKAGSCNHTNIAE